jgi:hypothetical protein
MLVAWQGPIGLEVKLTGWTFATGHNVLTNLYSGAAGGFKGSLTGSDGFDTTQLPNLLHRA